MKMCKLSLQKWSCTLFTNCPTKISLKEKMISHVINSDYMPPWPADPNFSNFLGEKTLSEKEKNYTKLVKTKK